MNDKEIREQKELLIGRVLKAKEEADEINKELGDLADKARAGGLTHHLIPFALAKGNLQVVVKALDQVSTTLNTNMLSVANRVENIRPDDFLQTPEGHDHEDD